VHPLRFLSAAAQVVAPQIVFSKTRHGKVKRKRLLAASPHPHTPQGSAISVSDQHATCQPRPLLCLAVKLDYCAAGP
jgi:hypothetical protein